MNDEKELIDIIDKLMQTGSGRIYVSDSGTSCTQPCADCGNGDFACKTPTVSDCDFEEYTK